MSFRVRIEILIELSQVRRASCPSREPAARALGAINPTVRQCGPTHGQRASCSAAVSSMRYGKCGSLVCRDARGGQRTLVVEDHVPLEIVEGHMEVAAVPVMGQDYGFYLREVACQGVSVVIVGPAD